MYSGAIVKDKNPLAKINATFVTFYQRTAGQKVPQLVY